jgi:hypothetical protein
MISSGDFHPLLLGDKQLFEGGQCLGHEGEDKKDRDYCCTFCNGANDVSQGG